MTRDILIVIVVLTEDGMQSKLSNTIKGLVHYKKWLLDLTNLLSF